MSICLGNLSQKCFESNTKCGKCDKKDAAALQRPLNREDDLEWPPLIGLRHPASASCLGRHLRLAGRCPNNSSLFPPLAAVVVVALWPCSAERVFLFVVPKRLRAFRNYFFTGGVTPTGSLRSPAPPKGELLLYLPEVEAPPERKDFPRSGGRCRAATKGGIWQARQGLTERVRQRD